MNISYHDIRLREITEDPLNQGRNVFRNEQDLGSFRSIMADLIAGTHLDDTPVRYTLSPCGSLVQITISESVQADFRVIGGFPGQDRFRITRIKLVAVNYSEADNNLSEVI